MPDWKAAFNRSQATLRPSAPIPKDVRDYVSAKMEPMADLSIDDTTPDNYGTMSGLSPAVESKMVDDIKAGRVPLSSRQFGTSGIPLAPKAEPATVQRPAFDAKQLEADIASGKIPSGPGIVQQGQARSQNLPDRPQGIYDPLSGIYQKSGFDPSVKELPKDPNWVDPADKEYQGRGFPAGYATSRLSGVKDMDAYIALENANRAKHGLPPVQKNAAGMPLISTTSFPIEFHPEKLDGMAAGVVNQQAPTPSQNDGLPPSQPTAPGKALPWARLIADIGSNIAGKSGSVNDQFFNDLRDYADQAPEREMKVQQMRDANDPASDLSTVYRDIASKQLGFNVPATMSAAKMREMLPQMAKIWDARADDQLKMMQMQAHMKAGATGSGAPGVPGATAPLFKNEADKQRYDNLQMIGRSLPAMLGSLAKGDWTFSPIDNTYTINRRMAAEAFGRMQSGGAINKDEEARFEKMLPSTIDSPEKQAEKLSILRQTIMDRARTLGVPLTPDIVDSLNSMDSVSIGKTGAKLSPMKDYLANPTGTPATPPASAPSAAPSSGPAAPKVGDVKNGYKYIGGPPGDKNSWQKVAA